MRFFGANLRDFRQFSRHRHRRGIAAEIGTTERRSPSPILIVLALDFLFLFSFLSFSLYVVGCASGVHPLQSFKIPLSDALFNLANRRPGPPTFTGRKDGGLFSFVFWLFMSVSVASLAQSSFPSPAYALLGFRSMVYATVCFLVVFVFGQSIRSVFLGKSLPQRTFPIFQPLNNLFLRPHLPSLPHR